MVTFFAKIFEHSLSYLFQDYFNPDGQPQFLFKFFDIFLRIKQSHIKISDRKQIKCYYLNKT